MKNRKGKKWTPEQKAKARATREANRAKNARSAEDLQRDVKDALYYLDRAVREVREEIRAGKRRMDQVTDYEVNVYMAKRLLEGGMR